MVMQVLNGLKRSLEIMLYPRELYERPQLESLTDYLVIEFERAHLGLAQTSGSFPSIDSGSALTTKSSVTVDEHPISRKTPGPVFILCSPRSGSTLLRVILAGHSGYSRLPSCISCHSWG